MARIDVERLGFLRLALFQGPDRITAPAMAEKMGVEYVTLWSWLNRRGMPDDKADALAGVFEGIAQRLIRAAGQLRACAREAREMEAAPDIATGPGFVENAPEGHRAPAMPMA